MNSLEMLRDECVACRKCEIGGVMIEGQFISNVFSILFSFKINGFINTCNVVLQVVSIRSISASDFHSMDATYE